MSLLAIPFFCFSQINFSDYKEPDGSLKRFILDPNFSYANVDGDNATNLSLQANYRLNTVKDRSIQNFNIRSGFLLDHVSANGISDTNFRSEQNLNFQYRRYFSERRGLFFETNTNLNVDYNGNEPNDNIRGAILPGVFIGYGRLENVSTVYQAMRIHHQMQQNFDFEQDQIFTLADALRTFDYNNKLDTRYRDIENQSQYLEEMKAMGYDLSNFYNIANAIDAFNFERPDFIFNGFEAKIGFRPFVSLNSGTSSNGNLSLSISHAKAINKQWHVQNNLLYETDFDDQTLAFSNTINFFPSARTNFRLTNLLSRREFNGLNFTNINSSLSGQYFVNPNMSVFASVNFSYLDNANFGSSTRFGSNFGFRYFIF